MNKKILIPLITGMVLLATSTVLFLPINESTNTETLSVSYIDTNQELQLLLDLQGIRMSSPLKLNGFSIDQYCTFFSDKTIQNAIEYCTSTELLDSNGHYLGNIHMVGSSAGPQYVIGVIQANPAISQLGEIKIVYDAMIESAVCDCWEEKKPGGFESVSEWINAAKDHHLDAKRTTSISEIGGLAKKDILLEITTNTEGYLWKFIIPV